MTKLLLGIACLLILVTILLGNLLFNRNEQISVKNSSKNYSLSYTPTPQFIAVLSEWGIFSKPARSIHLESGKIKKIVIELVDSKQSQYQSFNSFKDLTHSAGGELFSDGTYLIKVQLNTSIISSYTNEAAYNNYIVMDVLQLLFTAVHPEKLNSKMMNEQLYPQITEFTKNKSSNPFKITVLQ